MVDLISHVRNCATCHAPPRLCHVSAPHHTTVCHMLDPYGATCHNLCHVMLRVDLMTISTSCQVSIPCRALCRSPRLSKWNVMLDVKHLVIQVTEWHVSNCLTSCNVSAQHHATCHLSIAPRVCVWACHDIVTCQVVWHIIMPHASLASCHVSESLHVVCHISI
jgi:hypothetical protein